MNRYALYLAGAALLASSALSGCAANGRLAGKTNGPVDPAVTFKNVCNGTKIADGLFLAAATASGGHISAEDITIERDAYAAVAAICSGPVPVDLTSAVLAITADAIPIGSLVQKYTGKTVALSVPPN